MKFRYILELFWRKLQFWPIFHCKSAIMTSLWRQTGGVCCNTTLLRQVTKNSFKNSNNIIQKCQLFTVLSIFFFNCIKCFDDLFLNFLPGKNKNKQKKKPNKKTKTNRNKQKTKTKTKTKINKTKQNKKHRQN